jgi:hypothetical protein
MIAQDAHIPDPLADNAGILIKAIQAPTQWGPEQQGLLDQLVHMLGRKQYITITGDTKLQQFAQIGSSCLYDVPAKSRGPLRALRGRRVRLVCVDFEHQKPKLMVGIYEHPKEEV